MNEAGTARAAGAGLMIVSSVATAFIDRRRHSRPNSG